MISKAILYSFRRCPYAMRARMAIASSGMQVLLREVSLRDKPQSLVDISSKATVPVLLTTDNRVIDESLDIMLWALRQSDPDTWLTNINYALIKNNDGPFKQWLDRYKYADRYPEHTQQFYREQGEQTLLMLEQTLADSAFLAGKTATLTDIAIFPFIRQLFQTTMQKYSPWHIEDEEQVVFPRNIAANTS